MGKLRISAVSFLNTLPFQHALKHHPEIQTGIDVSYNIPSVCAEKLIKNEVDIGLVPVAAIPKIPEALIITDFCIGAKDKVDSVFLFSQTPRENLHTIVLDYRSMTSVRMIKYIAKYAWGTNYNWEAGKAKYENRVRGNTGAVVIGDMALKLRQKFAYTYDLAKEWYDLESNEFAFAAWISNKPIDEKWEYILNEAFREAIQNFPSIIPKYSRRYPDIPLYHYLTKRIDYYWNASKKISMERFLNFIDSEIS